MLAATGQTTKPNIILFIKILNKDKGTFKTNGTKHIYPDNTHMKGSLHNIFVQKMSFISR